MLEPIFDYGLEISFYWWGNVFGIISTPSRSCLPEVTILHPHQLSNYPLTTPRDLADIFFPISSSLPEYTLSNLQYARSVCLHSRIVLLGPTHVDRYT